MTSTVGLSDARSLAVFKQRISDEGIATILNMIDALDGYTEDGVELNTTTEVVTESGTVQRETVAEARFAKLDLVDQLFHTVASPPVAYLLLLIGLALIVFEFYTAGVGIAGVVGAVCVVLASYGLAALPARGWAVALLVIAMFAFAVDVQVGIPRFWTGVGIVLTIIGSLWLYEPVSGTDLRPSWLALITGIGGVMLTFIVGMPSMTRTRFATPTVGREWMIGAEGEAVTPIDPEGTVQVRNGQWHARTNRATPIAAGEQLRVAAIDGVTLEVEPLEGAARDYREMRKKSGESDADSSDVDAAPPTPRLTPNRKLLWGVDRNSAIRKAGPGDSEIVAASRDATGIELGHEREGELAARPGAVAELSDREAGRIVGQEFRCDSGGGVDRVDVEDDLVALDERATADQLPHRCAIVVGRHVRREPAGADLLDHRMIGERVDGVGAAHPTRLDHDLVQRLDHGAIVVVERGDVETELTGIVDRGPEPFVSGSQFLGRRDPSADGRFDPLAGEEFEFVDVDPARSRTTRSIERSGCARDARVIGSMSSTSPPPIVSSRPDSRSTYRSPGSSGSVVSRNSRTEPDVPGANASPPSTRNTHRELA